MTATTQEGEKLFALLRDRITVSYVARHAADFGVPVELCWQALRLVYGSELDKDKVLEQLSQGDKEKQRHLEDLVDWYPLLVEESGKRLSFFRGVYQRLRQLLERYGPIVGQQKVDSLLQCYDWEVVEEDGYLKPVLLMALGYRQARLQRRFCAREVVYWYRREVVKLQEIEQVVSLLWDYSRGDQSWTLRDVLGRLRETYGWEWHVEYLEGLMDLLAVEPLGDGRWRWAFGALRMHDQVVRIFREANRVLSLRELHEIYQQRTGRKVLRSQITSLLSGHETFCAFERAGHWGLREWDLEQRRTKIEILRELLASVKQPLKAAEIERLLLEAGYPDAKKWRVSAILRNRSDLFMAVRRRGQQSKHHLWMLREHFDSRLYEEIYRFRFEQRIPQLNQALHELIPKKGELVLPVYELVDRLVEKLGIQRFSVERYVRQLKHCRTWRQPLANTCGRRFTYLHIAIPYRPKADYWVYERQTTRDWMTEAVKRLLPVNGDWVLKKDLYEKLKAENPKLTRHAFYLYLQSMPFLEHYRNGRFYYCRRIA